MTLLIACLLIDHMNGNVILYFLAAFIWVAHVVYHGGKRK